MHTQVFNNFYSLFWIKGFENVGSLWANALKQCAGQVSEALFLGALQHAN